MTPTRLPLRLAVVAALFAATAAQATLTTFTSRTTFTTLTGASTDTLNDLSVSAGATFADLGVASLGRSAGDLAYTLGTENSLWVLPIAGNIGVGALDYVDSLTIGGFASPVLAVGASFFGTGVNGELASGALTVVATDINGLTRTASVAGNSLTAFLGFVSDVPLASIKVSMTSPNTNVWTSLDNVAISAVPEASTWMMMLAGGAAMLRVASRRRA